MANTIHTNNANFGKVKPKVKVGYALGDIAAGNALSVFIMMLFHKN